LKKTGNTALDLRFFGNRLLYAMNCLHGKEVTVQIRMQPQLLTFLLPFRRNFSTR